MKISSVRVRFRERSFWLRLVRVGLLRTEWELEQGYIEDNNETLDFAEMAIPLFSEVRDEAPKRGEIEKYKIIAVIQSLSKRQND
jgi:hypothetical protein